MSKQEWIRLGYSEADAEELSRLAEISVTTASFNNIDEATKGSIKSIKELEKEIKK